MTRVGMPACAFRGLVLRELTELEISPLLFLCTADVDTATNDVDTVLVLQEQIGNKLEEFEQFEQKCFC